MVLSLFRSGLFFFFQQWFLVLQAILWHSLFILSFRDRHLYLIDPVSLYASLLSLLLFRFCFPLSLPLHHILRFFFDNCPLKTRVCKLLVCVIGTIFPHILQARLSGPHIEMLSSHSKSSSSLFDWSLKHANKTTRRLHKNSTSLLLCHCQSLSLGGADTRKRILRAT